MADLSVEEFMKSGASELTPDSFMASAPGQTNPAVSPQVPAGSPSSPTPSGAGFMEPFRRIGEMVLGSPRKPTAIGEIVFPMTETDPTVLRDLRATRAPWEAPPILDLGAIGVSKAMPSGAVRGAAQGVEEFMSGLSSPTNVMLMGGMGLLKAAPTLQKLASAGFSIDMLRGAYEQNEQFQQAVQAGDTEAAARAFVGLTGSAAMGVGAAKHAVATPKQKIRIAPDTPAEAESRRISLAENRDLAEARTDPAQASKLVNKEIERRQAAGQWDAALEKTPSPQEARARKQASRVTVPEEGDQNPALTYQRGNVAAELAGKGYEELTPEERSSVDDLVRQGYGMREAGTESRPSQLPSDQSRKVESGTRTEDSAVIALPADKIQLPADTVGIPSPKDTPVRQARVEEQNAVTREALREDAQRILDESTLDAATKPSPNVRLDQDGVVREVRNPTYQEAQEARRAERLPKEPEPLLDQIADAEPEPSFMRRLDETGKEASKRLQQRLSKTSSANEFLNPETIRDMAQAIAGDVARGTLKLAEVGRRLSAEYGPKARAVAQKVWAEAQNIIRISGQGSRERQRGSIVLGGIEPKAEPTGSAPPKKTATAEAPASPGDGAIPVSPSYEKTKGKILDKLDVSEETKKQTAGKMQEWESAHPERKKITHAEIREEARKLDPSILADMDTKAAQDIAIKDPAMYHAARQAIPGLIEKAARIQKEVDKAPRGADVTELQNQLEQANQDAQQMLNVTIPVRSQHGRNLAMHRMTVDTVGFDPTYWVGRAKKSMGLPPDASLPPEVQRDLNGVLAEGRAAEQEALGKIREQEEPKPNIEAPVPKRKQDRRTVDETGAPIEPPKAKEKPQREAVDTTTPPTPEEKIKIDADANVQAARRNLARKMAKLQKTSLLDTISAIRRAGLLTSPRTMIRNIGGNFTMMALEEISRVPGAMLDVGISLFSKQRTVQGPSGIAIARSSYAAATKGIAEARQIMKHGSTAEQLAQFDMVKELNLGGGRPSRVMESYVNGVFRFMSATDRVFKRYAIERSLQEQQKLAGVDKPTEAMMAQAIADADFATFNNQNKLADMFSRAKRGASPGTRFAMDMTVPFVRTPANVFARVLDYSGGGLLKAGAGGIKAAIDKSMTPEQQRAISQNFGRGVTGPALIYMGYQLAAAGLATGSYQADAGKRNTDEAAGRLAGAVKIGGTWQMVSPLSPGGALITIGATLQREATGPLKDEAKRPGKLLSVIGRTVLDHPFLQGAKEIIEAISDPERQGERAAASMAGSFVPSAVSDVASLGDKVRRDSRTDGGTLDASAAAMAARTPGARNTLPERKDVLGRPLPQSNTAVVNPGIGSQAKEDSDPIIRELVRNKVALSEPQKAPGETLDQFRMRREILGHEIEKQLGREIATPTYRALDTEDERRGSLDKAEGRARRLVAAKLGKRYAGASAAARMAMLTELLKSK